MAKESRRRVSSDDHPRVPRSLVVAMTLQFAVGGAIMPFISILLRDRGLDFAQTSRVFLASCSTLLVFPFLWGMLADRFIPLNRLFIILNLLGVSALALFASRQHFLGLLLAFTCFYACFNPTLTLINALSFHHLKNPREQFGRLRSWGSLGWILPSLPVYVWLVFGHTAKLDFVIYLALALSLAMAGTAWFLPHTPTGATKAGLESSRAYWPAVKRLLQDANYLTILLSFFLIAASFSILVFYSPPFLEDHGIQREWIGPVQSIGIIVEIILFRWRSAFVRRLSYHATILIGCVALFARHLIFAFSDNLWLLCLSYFLAGIVIVFYHIGVSILVNTLATAAVRSTAQTLLVFFGSGMGPMFSNWLAGQIAARAGENLRPVFLFAAGLAGLASLLILLRGRKLDHGANRAAQE